MSSAHFSILLSSSSSVGCLENMCFVLNCALRNSLNWDFASSTAFAASIFSSFVFAFSFRAFAFSNAVLYLSIEVG